MLPIFNIFELWVKENEKNAYVAVGKNNITKSVLNDEGTLGMYLVQEKENPNMTYMFEVYEDEKSYQEHIKSEQYKGFLRQSPTILTNHKKKIQVMSEYMGDKKFVQTRNTRVNYVTVDVKEGFNDAFREIVLDEMKQSIKKEEGVYVIYAATAKKNPLPAGTRRGEAFPPETLAKLEPLFYEMKILGGKYSATIPEIATA